MWKKLLPLGMVIVVFALFLTRYEKKGVKPGEIIEVRKTVSGFRYFPSLNSTDIEVVESNYREEISFSDEVFEKGSKVVWRYYLESDGTNGVEN